MSLMDNASFGHNTLLKGYLRYGPNVVPLELKGAEPALYKVAV